MGETWKRNAGGGGWGNLTVLKMFNLLNAGFQNVTAISNGFSRWKNRSCVGTWLRFFFELLDGLIYFLCKFSREQFLFR